MFNPIYLSVWKELFTVPKGGFYRSLPLLITLAFIGLVLAAVYLTFIKFLEAKLLKVLYEKDATRQETSTPLSQLGILKNGKINPFYKWFLSTPSSSFYHTCSCDILDSRTHEDYKQKKGKAPSPIKIPLNENTRFYILPKRVSYVKERGMHFTSQHWMQLVYTVLTCGIAWFVFLWCLDSILMWFS